MTRRPLDALLARLNSESSLLRLLNAMPLGVAVLGPDGRIGAVNRVWETLTGTGLAEIRGLACLHAVRCDFCMKGCPLPSGQTCFAPLSRDGDILTRDRRRLPVRFTLAPLGGQNGAPAAYLETIQALDVADPARAAAARLGFSGLIGSSPQMDKLFRMIPSVAQTDSSVLITGETGTGKDALAEAIHKASDRARGPFIKVNCGALPDTLLESELFGHAKGAFTGAERAKPGRVQLAHGGTLFLTEIGDLPLGLQVKLLSFLDDKVIYPLGSTTGFHADVRVVVATHRDLEGMVREQRFRQDLLFRLNVIRLHMPPLRERGHDVELLLRHFIQDFRQRFQKKVEGLTEEAQLLLTRYQYPGNVRELRNIVEYAVNFCDGKRIGPQHLPPYLVEQAACGALLPPKGEAPGGAPAASAGPPAAARSTSWEEAEQRMIMEALVRAGGRRGEAARLLGWARSTLWRKVRRYGID